MHISLICKGWCFTCFESDFYCYTPTPKSRVWSKVITKINYSLVLNSAPSSKIWSTDLFKSRINKSALLCCKDLNNCITSHFSFLQNTVLYSLNLLDFFTVSILHLFLICKNIQNLIAFFIIIHCWRHQRINHNMCKKIL